MAAGVEGNGPLSVQVAEHSCLHVDTRDVSVSVSVGLCPVLVWIRTTVQGSWVVWGCSAPLGFHGGPLSSHPPNQSKEEFGAWLQAFLPVGMSFHFHFSRLAQPKPDCLVSLHTPLGTGQMGQLALRRKIRLLFPAVWCTLSMLS